MDDERYPTALTDPALILIALGALFGLLAASYWYKVFKAAGPVPDAAGGRGDLSSAAFATAVALFLSCGGFLFGLFTGRF